MLNTEMKLVYSTYTTCSYKLYLVSDIISQYFLFPVDLNIVILKPGVF